MEVIIILAIIVADQLTKYLAVIHLRDMAL